MMNAGNSRFKNAKTNHISITPNIQGPGTNVMNQDKKDSTVTGDTASNPTLGMPKEMNITDICRGMQTGWPQLIVAMKKLKEDPAFCNSFPLGYASGEGLAIGRPEQLLSALMIDPAYLTKPTPPADVYAHSVWLTMRVYEAAQTVSTTLATLPGVLPAEKDATAAMVKEVLDSKSGLTGTAANIISLANDFTQQLETIGGNLQSAQTDYQEISDLLENQKPVGESDNLFRSIATHPQAIATSYGINQQLDDLGAAAAKVTAFAVIENMRLAVQSLSTAWQVTQEQFEKVAGSDPANLGDPSFLQNTLQLETAAGEWAAFAEVTNNFLKGALVIR
jgi:hypothetical protein